GSGGATPGPPPAAPRDPELRTHPHRTGAAAATAAPGVLLGGGVLPAPMLADLVTAGARIKALPTPAELPTEPGYRPSVNLATWVRTRDLVCSFPGCTHCAQRCDIDHVIPWPAGATHPGNLSAKCRTHHLLKTFGGWTDRQHPDGTHTWTSPTGHAYTTVPLTRILFPDRVIPTLAPPAQAVTTTSDRHLAMPRRRRTRTETRTARIIAMRRLNQDTYAEPPPF
ncbi:HNH endonuclease signature motif containing protein, partial [Mycolicibacterium canariasense]